MKTSKYVLGFVFSEDLERVLLIKKKRPAWQAGKLNGIGGKIEPGETPVEAMAREAMEEVWIECEAWSYFAKMVGDRDKNMSNEPFEVHCFAARQQFFLTQYGSDEKAYVFNVNELSEYGTLPNIRMLCEFARLVLKDGTGWPSFATIEYTAP